MTAFLIYRGLHKTALGMPLAVATVLTAIILGISFFVLRFQAASDE